MCDSNLKNANFVIKIGAIPSPNAGFRLWT